MSKFKELLQEFREKGKLEALTKNRVILLKQEWFKEHAKECEKCGRKDNLTLDHIIPARMIKEFGIEEEKQFMPENYRILCKICNTFKGDRLDLAEKRTKQLLITFLEAI